MQYRSTRLIELRHNRPLRNRQRNPPPNQTKASQRRNRPQELEALGIENKQIYRAREHCYAGGEKTHGERVLWRYDGREGQDRGVYELVRCVLVRCGNGVVV